MRRRPGTANSFTNTPGLEPSSDADSDSDFESDEDAQFVYIPANSPFNTPASTARTASAYLPLSAIPFACDALAEEDPLFASSPSDLFDDKFQHSAGPLLDGEGNVVVIDLENTGGELLITRGWTQDSYPKSLSKGVENGHNVEARVSQQYM
ncbi:hypothetical protein BDZ94DRAFT_1261228 [Collybia nuda]|uniref:Uncharacterized protein n=1 Tax=Collybia nuda TaxID=64659 RepID=A0A9P5Y746_9AGAR|nr:hypothetical protein BDZ94DRAFT_1261228 [Collybia nuda]